ncbi:hypothetical protein G3341_13425 [Providencia vermicola]|uniref:Uncharacterized protein n=2 Tax=Providencia TaxID=586 RepID=A0AAI9MWN7_PROST|nr:MULTISPECIES: hypothetical protein [Providencia]ELR5036983.1 hypothetical protein [Providencia stuartii]QIC16615.1 hypothetical protein G3341_13425 [Providencia vermicola]
MRADQYIAYCFVRAMKREKDILLLQKMSYVKHWVLCNQAGVEVIRTVEITYFLDKLRDYLDGMISKQVYFNQQQQIVIADGDVCVKLFTVEWTGENAVLIETVAEQSISSLQNEGHNQQAFLKTLQEIERLAMQIGETGFAAIFRSQAEKLLKPVKNNEMLCECLFDVACGAWVFGGMGSWNDSAPFLAYEKGLEPEYDKLTHQLYHHIQHALRYSANHCDVSTES